MNWKHHEKEKVQMNCPVCLFDLPDQNLPFCPVCAWDLKNDLTLNTFLSPIPDSEFDIYRNRIELARQNWEKMLQNKANEIKIHENRMVLYEQAASALFETYIKTQNDQYLQLAIDQLTAALHENPDFKQGWLNVGNFYRLKKEMNNARSCYQRALEIDPDYVCAKDNLDGLNAGGVS